MPVTIHGSVYFHVYIDALYTDRREQFVESLSVFCFFSRFPEFRTLGKFVPEVSKCTLFCVGPSRYCGKGEVGAHGRLTDPGAPHLQAFFQHPAGSFLNFFSLFRLQMAKKTTSAPTREAAMAATSSKFILGFHLLGSGVEIF